MVNDGRKPPKPRQLRQDEDDPLHGTRGVTTSLALKGTEVAVIILLVLFAIFACLFALSHRRRLPRVRSVRAILSLSIIMWIVGTLASHGAFWDTVDAISGWEPRGEDRELLCKVHAVFTYGIAEPCVFAFVLAHLLSRTPVDYSAFGIGYSGMYKPARPFLCYRKDGEAAVPWQPWRIIRLICSIALILGLIQARPLARRASRRPSDPARVCDVLWYAMVLLV